MPDNNNMILEFPLNGIQLDLGTTATFDDISGYLNTGRLEGNFPADRTSFDNTDTDLESTDTESAIKEVNTKANTKADAQAVSQAFEGVERALATKADAEATSQALATKADKVDTYTKEQVDELIDDVPKYMSFKGTLGEGGTIEVLPPAAAEYDGYTFRVITEGTYAGVHADVGDNITCCIPMGETEYTWTISAEGDTDTDTWRAIKVNGVEKLGNGISSGNVDLVDTTNVKAHFDGDGNKVSFTLDGIDTSAQVDEKVAGLIDDETASEGKVFSSSKVTELVNAKPSIDDTTEATDKVWSSKKTFDEIVNILPNGVASGSIANFNTSLDLPLVSSKFDVNATQEAGTPTPQSPKVISGVSAVKLGYVDMNQLAKEIRAGQGYGTSFSYLGTLTYDNGTVTDTAREGGLDLNYSINLAGGHKYLIVGKLTTSINATLNLRTISTSAIIDQIPMTANTEKTYNKVIAPQTATKLQFMCLASIGDTLSLREFNIIDLTQAFGEKIANYLYSLSDNGLSIAKQLFTKDYYSYNEGGTIVTLDSVNGEPTSQNAVINLGGTYYGGYVTQDKNGKRVLVVTHGKYVITGNETFSTTGSGQHVLSGLEPIYNNLKLVAYDSVLADIKCTVAQDKTYSSLNVAGTTDGIGVGSRFLIVGSEQYDNWANLAGEEIVYELKTPFTVELPDGEPIIAFNGVNNVYADSGDCEVVYKKSIDDAIAELQALILNA